MSQLADNKQNPAAKEGRMPQGLPNYAHAKVQDSVVGIATRYRLVGAEFESPYRLNFPHTSLRPFRLLCYEDQVHCQG